jgi:threonylcarbamoyladenosine tRNA methylthiotransferase MtaB
LAAEMEDVVPVHTRNNRNKILRQLSYQKSQYFKNQHIGETRKVLWEKAQHGNMMEGYTDNYIKLETPYREDWAHSIMDWKVL